MVRLILTEMVRMFFNMEKQLRMVVCQMQVVILVITWRRYLRLFQGLTLIRLIILGYVCLTTQERLMVMI